MARRYATTRTRPVTVRETAATPTENLASVQEEMFRTLLQTPHRKVDEIINVHRAQFERDPNFYGHLATYAAYLGNCAVRDVNEVFVAMLFASPYIEHRYAAFVMLQKLPPYQVMRVMRFVTGYNEVVCHRSIDEPIPHGRFGITVKPAVYSSRFPDADKRGKPVAPRTKRLSKLERQKLLKDGKIKSGDSSFTVNTFFVHHDCLNKKNVSGQLKEAVRAYLRFRELPENQGMLEGALLRGRKAIRELYARTHTVPGGNESSWVNQYLFHGKTVEGTRLHALHLLAISTDPTEQAKIIIDNKIPYPIVVSMVKNITPSVLVAMIEVMSPQELMSNVGMLTKRGATNHPEVKALIESKLQSIKTAKKARVDALKGAFAAKSVENLDEEVASILTSITDSQLKQHGNAIKARTAILIDKSGSMEDAIELGKELASVIAQSCEKIENLKVFLFDTTPTEVQWQASDGDITTKSAWDRKLRMFRANGGTDPAQVIRALTLSKTAIDQILIITDEGENTQGKFARQLKDYEKTMGFLPPVVIVRVGKETGRGYPDGVSDRIEKSCKSEGIEVDVFRCEKIDQVAIPNVLQLLSRKSVFELVQDILAVPLPVKDDLRKVSNFDKVLCAV